MTSSGIRFRIEKEKKRKEKKRKEVKCAAPR